MNAGINHIQQPSTAPWCIPLSRADYTKLLGGFAPRDMDDKWRCYADEPDTKGNTAIHLCRSWTGNEQFILTVVVGSSNEAETKAGRWATVTKIAWRRVNVEGTYITEEEEAKETAFNICKGVMGCELKLSASRNVSKRGSR
jgi:hypothetical protein